MNAKDKVEDVDAYVKNFKNYEEIEKDYAAGRYMLELIKV